ncbi:uncharacterized protein LOC125257144 isoform X2 [Megalobrama amblycephala]|uniref:uncharacterized protein LOC125257144 isoform X2 n=1 Tax=Megalobrama amblycephala TaxID=75352 RepID=UPI0020148136|nr:uncharacterized protein LOC125257144 isoform X2 [Megalobrama amblycephala]
MLHELKQNTQPTHNFSTDIRFSYDMCNRSYSLDLPQAKLTASASVIMETDTVQLSCENTEDLKMEMCYFNIYGSDSNSKLSSSCQLSLTGSEISIWSEGQSLSVRITCFYTVKNSQVLITSPHSDPVTVTIQNFSVVKVSPDVLSESSSVKMICETPADVTVNQSFFYINSDEKNMKLSPSCELNLTGAEVLIWAAVKSPASVDINCFYTIHEDGIDKPSSRSPAATVTVLGALQKPNIVYHSDDQSLVSCEILLSVRAGFICSLYTEEGLLHQTDSQKSQSGDHYCLFYLSHSELFTRSVNSQLSCDYSLNTEPEIRSQRSDTITIRDLPQAKLTASASLIKETDTVQLSCENTEDLKMEMCVFNINGRESNSKLSSSCKLSLTGSQISIWSEGQSSSVRITCFYTLKKSRVLITSPHSDPVTVQISTATSTGEALITAKETFSTATSTGEALTTATQTLRSSYLVRGSFSVSIATSTGEALTKATETFVKASTPGKTAVIETPKPKTWLIMALAATGGGVFLSGLMGVCLFCISVRLRRKSLMIASVAAISQNPVSDDIDDNKEPSEENEDAVYCTVPDDSELDSLAQMPNHPLTI